MKVPQMISLDFEIITSIEFIELKRNNSLSRVINDFLRERIKVNSSENQKRLREIEAEKYKLSIEESAIKISISEKKRAEEKEASEWKEIL